MARPRFAGGERPFSVNVYLTAKEWLRLVETARATGVSKSAVIRKMLADTPVRASDVLMGDL